MAADSAVVLTGVKKENCTGNEMFLQWTDRKRNNCL